MAYSTGSASTAAGLISAIGAFATSLGWTVTPGATTTIAKGTVSVGLLSDSPARIKMIWSGSPALTIDNRIAGGSFPWTYHLFGNASPDPDQIICVVNFNVVEYRYLGFGNIRKFGNWTGGEWFASTSASNDSIPKIFTTNSVMVGSVTMGTPGGSTGGLFVVTITPGVGIFNTGSYLHAEIDGGVWLTGNSGVATWVDVGGVVAFLIDRQPNAWNSQAVLLPYWIRCPRPSNKVSVIGEVANVRVLRIDNITPGDIITLGVDQWVVFPYIKKDIVNRNGVTSGGSTIASGTYGWALKK